ncbi:hypothetical protein QBC39DRAFT_375525 [Podospora conica]|nr:hypothetical protein QBC39DRAFT_375525 [Schizothecium conicum]
MALTVADTDRFFVHEYRLSSFQGAQPLGGNRRASNASTHAPKGRAGDRHHSQTSRLPSSILDSSDRDGFDECDKCYCCNGSDDRDDRDGGP